MSDKKRLDESAEKRNLKNPAADKVSTPPPPAPQPKETNQQSPPPA